MDFNSLSSYYELKTNVITYFTVRKQKCACCRFACNAANDRNEHFERGKSITENRDGARYVCRVTLGTTDLTEADNLFTFS